MSKEYDRVLTNPDNLIISEELEGMLDFEGASVANITDCILSIDDNEFSCSLVAFYKKEDCTQITLEVPSLLITDLLDASLFKVMIDDREIETDCLFEFSIQGGNRILILEKKHVTERDNERTVL